MVIPWASNNVNRWPLLLVAWWWLLRIALSKIRHDSPYCIFAFLFTSYQVCITPNKIWQFDVFSSIYPKMISQEKWISIVYLTYNCMVYLYIHIDLHAHVYNHKGLFDFMYRKIANCTNRWSLDGGGMDYLWFPKMNIDLVKTLTYKLYCLDIIV